MSKSKSSKSSRASKAPPAPKKPKPFVPSLDDLTERPPPTAAQTARVITLARLQYKLQNDLAAKTAELEKIAARLRKVQEDDLPEAMLSAGIESQRLTGGYELALETETRANISKARKEAAFDWLEQNGHGDLIKHEVWMQFGRSEEALAQQVIKYLRQRKYAAGRLQDDRSVHASTLGAFVREQLAEGAALPMDLLGVYRQTRAVISPPKKEEV